MMEEKLPAEVRLYGMLAVRTSWPYGPGPYDPFPKWGDVWTMCYASKLPSSVTLYGSQTKDDDASWVEISHFEQDRRIDNKERWCERCNENGDYLIISRDALDLASPCFITVEQVLPFVTSSIRREIPLSESGGERSLFCTYRF